MRPYADRRAAGAVLAPAVAEVVPASELPIVLALTRGGVPVAAAVAETLDAPLDVIVVRKLGLARDPEYALGAIASVGGRTETVFNDEAAAMRAALDEPAGRQPDELAQRARDFRGNRAAVDLVGHTVVVVDDGVATGASMTAAVTAVRGLMPRRVVIAVPVSLGDAVSRLREIADGVVCPWPYARFPAVGHAYLDFDQTGDEEVRAILAAAASR